MFAFREKKTRGIMRSLGIIRNPPFRNDLSAQFATG